MAESLGTDGADLDPRNFTHVLNVIAWDEGVWLAGALVRSSWRKVVDGHVYAVV